MHQICLIKPAPWPLLEPMKPKQASLRRAIAAANYSIFHLLIDEAARRISANAALQTIIARSCAHKNLKEAANKIIAQSSPQPSWPGKLLSTPIEPELGAKTRASDTATVFLLLSAKLLPGK